MLRFLFYLAVGYLLVRFLMRMVNPPQKPPKEGDTRVDYAPPKQKEPVVGEYVDFEEIPDEK